MLALAAAINRAEAGFRHGSNTCRGSMLVSRPVGPPAQPRPEPVLSHRSSTSRARDVGRPEAASNRGHSRCRQSMRRTSKGLTAWSAQSHSPRKLPARRQPSSRRTSVAHEPARPVQPAKQPDLSYPPTCHRSLAARFRLCMPPTNSRHVLVGLHDGTATLIMPALESNTA